QREGIEAAKKKGKHLGRPKTKITQEFIDVYNDWKQGKITALYAMKKCNMTSPTFYRVVKRYEDKE
ncbi:DNA recombinase, partial [Bacillus thuringiensis]